MKSIIRFGAASLLGLGLGITSCKKENTEQQMSAVQKDLISKTWQVEKVIDYAGGSPSILYQRNAIENTDDFSLVRQTYKANGSITYIDQFGESGTDGSYELLSNNTKIKLKLASIGLSVTAENLKVTATSYSYTLKHAEGDSTRFIFSPQ